TRPDLFQPQHRDTHYALAHYHLMGSRILSRSFHVERWKRARTDHPGDKDGGLAGDASMDVDVDVDVDREQEAPADEGAGRDADADAEELDVLVDDSDDSDDEEDPADIAMVPMADMLNARFGSENAKLFYEEHSLLMNVTKPVPKGEQIWNTYGDPPNSDLLRRYGHVDLVPLPDGEFGNPADIVEVPADFAVASLTHQRALQSSDPFTERVDWWLEEGGDDVFILEYPDELPDDFISFLRVLSISEPEWQKTKLKSKLPKPKLDSEVLSVAVDVLQRRLSAYPTSIDDRQALSAGTLNANKLHAVVVRLGEKRILQAALVKAKAKLDALSSPGSKGTAGARKRKLEGGEDKKSGRKAKR
ncbi:RuBisCo LSMT C-terminal, substrate-binding domain-containing protein, partial [Auriscalpium vulgare]